MSITKFISYTQKYKIHKKTILYLSLLLFMECKSPRPWCETFTFMNHDISCFPLHSRSCGTSWGTPRHFLLPLSYMEQETKQFMPFGQNAGFHLIFSFYLKCCFPHASHIFLHNFTLHTQLTMTPERYISDSSKFALNKFACPQKQILLIFLYPSN